MQLANTTDSIELVTSTGGADIDVVLDFVDITQEDPPVVKGTTSGRQLADGVVTATTTTICSAPAASTIRRVTEMTIRNRHASVTETITIQYNSASPDPEIHKTTLLPGEMLFYSDSLGFYTHSAGKTAATQSDQETGTDLTKFVSPGVQHYHPSAAKCWGKVTVSGGTPTIAVSYNTTSITDAGVSRLTVTIGNDFSSANYATQVSIEPSTTTYSATTTCLAPVIRNATLAAGSFTADALEFDIGQATDVSSWHWTCFGDL